MTRMIGILAAAALALPLGSCAMGPRDTGVAQAGAVETDVAGAIGDRPELSTLARAVTEAGLTEELAGAGPFTIFAPTDEAFNALPQDARDKLFQDDNRAQLETLLRHHIVRGEAYPATEIPDRLTPMAGEPIDVALVQGRPVLSPGDGPQAGITGDIETDNGIIHVVDTVLIPQQVAQALQIGPQQAQQQAQGPMQQQVQQMQQSLQQAEQALQQNDPQQARQALDQVRQALGQAEEQAQGQQQQSLSQVDQQLQQAENALRQNDTQQAQQALAQAQQPLRQMSSQ